VSGAATRGNDGAPALLTQDPASASLSLRPGESFVCGPNGAVIARAPRGDDAILYTDVSLAVSTERTIDIPEPVRDVYRQWRPTPLFRARRLERALQTPARIYYKYEGVSPAGSHKPNTAVAQAFFNKEAGVKKIVTETGAGQWGSALAFAGAVFGLDVQVFMVRVSYNQKPYRRAFMETFGARCLPSPSTETQFGRQVLAESPDSPGSLGIAISEAVKVAGSHDDTKNALGSVLNHVLLHQTILGQEAMAQLDMANDYPDVVVGCTGGGPNFAGLAFPFIGAQLRGGPAVRAIAVEPAACPSLTRGRYAYGQWLPRSAATGDVRRALALPRPSSAQFPQTRHAPPDVKSTPALESAAPDP